MGEYDEEAKPTFKKLVKTQPGNGNYNLWYGVCCLETGEPAEALKYKALASARLCAEIVMLKRPNRKKRIYFLFILIHADCSEGQKYKFIVNKAGFRNSILLILL